MNKENNINKQNIRTKHGHFVAIIERDEDGMFVGTVPALRSCYTQAKTIDELTKRLEEVILLCLCEQEDTILEFVGMQTIEV
jgi:predicted RNase H-like HicB family nuclease